MEETATLNTPHLGYSQIRLIEKKRYKWEVEILGSGKIIEIYEDEFIVN